MRETIGWLSRELLVYKFQCASVEMGFGRTCSYGAKCVQTDQFCPYLGCFKEERKDALFRESRESSVSQEHS